MSALRWWLGVPFLLIGTAFCVIGDLIQEGRQYRL
jgi:hypothetical protein